MTGAMHPYGRYCRPALAEMLEAFSLDAQYVRAEGDTLWQERDGELVEVLDLVGGFGATLFGHYHPQLVAEERRLTEARVPMMAQGSMRLGAARLAEALAGRLGDYVAIFTNSGTETVEAAIKHAYLERGRPLFWAVRRAFHGKTIGSIQLTESHRSPYEPLGPRVRVLDPEDEREWPVAAAEADAVSAAFIEPVLGEGGARCLPPRFLEWITGLCRAHDIPLVADEIQTGMGRCGTFLASEQLALDPDYICLSKALGGGLAKIGALLVKRNRLVPAFARRHTSTFAEDDRSCLLALRALELVDRDAVPARCARLGAYLTEALAPVMARYPKQVKEVRGRGLLLGVELHDQSDSPSNTLRMLSQQRLLGYAAAAYLLNVHRIRVAPTLSEPMTIRLEPSAYVSTAQLDRFVDAFAMMCDALRAADVAHLTAFQVGLPSAPVRDHSAPRPFRREAPRTPRRVAFLGHLLHPEDAADWDSSLGALPRATLEQYMARPARALAPSVFDQANIQSATGALVHLSYIGLDFTPRQAEAALRAGDTGWLMEKIEEAVAMGRDLGCSIVGLGAYTSIIAGNCRRVRTSGIALTSGNALTVGTGLLALRRAASARGIDPARAWLGVFGATGNIASTYAKMMAPEVAGLVLVARDAGSPRVQRLLDEISAAAPRTPVRVAADPSALRECQLVLTASNAAGARIEAHHLAPGPAVVCDVSLPSDLVPTLGSDRPDLLVIGGGIVRLPRDPDLRIAGVTLPPGHVYACLAETLLLGLEGGAVPGTCGAVTPEGVHRMLALAERHGFTLGDFKPIESPSTELATEPEPVLGAAEG